MNGERIFQSEENIKRASCASVIKVRSAVDMLCIARTKREGGKFSENIKNPSRAR